LFEPIVITIPKSDQETAASSETKSTPTLEIVNPDGRPRLVDGKPVQVIDPPPCELSLSQEKISVVSSGGEISVLLGVEKGSSIADIKFVVSSPDDISVELEPGIAGIEGRALYRIRSTSDRIGDYRVTFYLPCGKKDLAVTVR